MLLCLWSPLPDSSLAGQQHGRTIPLADLGRSVPFFWFGWSRELYIALIKNLSFNADNNGKIFLATRKAAADLGASQRTVCVWFRELEHFGFIVMTEPGTAMRAARWRITDVGWGNLDGKSIEPTKDYLK